MNLKTIALALCLSLAAATANAHDIGHDMIGHDMTGHDMTETQPASASDSSKAYAEAMAKMHEKMSVPLTGNADVDFAAGMIPHHEGAVDMAKVVIQYGKDPELRKLAEAIVAAQESEIAFMKAWLEKQPK